VKRISLRALPKVRDSWSYLYVDRGRIARDTYGVTLVDERGKVPIPAASLTLLMLGPGTTISHAAVQALAASGCLIAWTGEEAVRFYAIGMGETSSSRNLLQQVAAYGDPTTRISVVRRLYEMRFGEALDPGLSLRQIRGREGARVRDAYAAAARATGVEWRGRSYDKREWARADPVNRALSSANACLYGVCASAIIAAGYSPAIGFIHTGKVLSFAYDIADLYKTEISIPAAFAEASSGGNGLESRVRRACRRAFKDTRLLRRIVPDIQYALTASRAAGSDNIDEEAVAGLWDPEHGATAGGVNYAETDQS
jgi:CRISP-associated protein Cas1